MYVRVCARLVFVGTCRFNMLFCVVLIRLYLYVCFVEDVLLFGSLTFPVSRRMMFVTLDGLFLYLLPINPFYI